MKEICRINSRKTTRKRMFHRPTRKIVFDDHKGTFSRCIWKEGNREEKIA